MGGPRQQESFFRARIAAGGGSYADPAGRDLGAAVLQGACALALSAFAGLVLAKTDNLQFAGVLLAGAAFAAIGMVRPALFLSMLLIARPLLDGNGGARVQDIPSSNAAGGLGVVLILVFVVVLATSREFKPPRGTTAFLTVIIVSGLAAAQALLEVKADLSGKLITEMIRLVALFCVFLLASHVVRGDDAVRKLFVVVGLSGVLPAANGIYQLFTGVEATYGFELGRITGTFVGPLPYSSFLAITSLILIALPSGALDWRIRVPSVAIMLVALVGTYSREGWILFLMGLLLIQWRERKAVVMLIIALALATVAIVPDVRDRVLPGQQDAQGRTSFESFGWRTDNWRGLLMRYEERPLTGWGLRTTRYVNKRAPVGFQSAAGGGYEAHNTAVRALVEGGLLLLLAYGLLFAAMIKTMYLGAMDRGWALRPYARILMFLWIALVVIALGTDDPVEATAMMIAVLALTGAISGAYGRWRDEQHAPAAMGA